MIESLNGIDPGYIEQAVLITQIAAGILSTTGLTLASWKAMEASAEKEYLRKKKRCCLQREAETRRGGHKGGGYEDHRHFGTEGRKQRH